MIYTTLVTRGTGNLGSSSVSLEADSQIDQELITINNSLYGNIQ